MEARSCKPEGGLRHGARRGYGEGGVCFACMTDCKPHPHAHPHTPKPTRLTPHGPPRTPNFTPPIPACPLPLAHPRLQAQKQAQQSLQAAALTNVPPGPQPIQAYQQWIPGHPPSAVGTQQNFPPQQTAQGLQTFPPRQQNFPPPGPQQQLHRQPSILGQTRSIMMAPVGFNPQPNASSAGGV